MKNSSVTVYIPGLWAILHHAGSEIQESMPSLQLLLKRCDHSTESSLESEALLLNRLGWQNEENNDVPVAALERLQTDSDGVNDYFWFRADPVNLQKDQNYLVMSSPSVLNLDLDESKTLADSINQHFAEDGWHVEVMDNSRWYLRLDKNPLIRTTPAWRVVGRDVFNLMPKGENSPQWHSWLMELQMLLFSHPVNEKRTEQGLAAVNGLWLWGGGNLPELLEKHQFCLRGDSLFIQGVARQSGSKLKDLSDDMAKIYNDFESNKEQLIMLEDARTALQSGNLDQGVAALKKLENSVFRPLFDLLKSKKLHSMSIVDSPGYIVNISARGANKWWRHRDFDLNSRKPD
ncbi:MAG: hypothetical protein BMS9Abin25_0830 [Gammaproteobacteria bacterium]|nr:MAG: hypothetical protein BMS9Abin25_0830 [Gammaproteobacteria bacterium]